MKKNGAMAEAHILIVEDESIVAKDVKNMLEKIGYYVPAVVSSGEKAIQKAEEAQPDLVLMDIMLKGDIDGVEAAEEIRNRFGIPVVYLTAYADDDTMRRAKITEPYGYILKPFQERELYIAVEMALHKHEMGKKLRERAHWFSTTLNSIGDAVITTDAAGYVTFMNPVAQSLTGWKQEEAAGKPLKDVFNIVNEKTGKPVEDPAAKVIQSGVVVAMANHKVLIARDGKRLPIDDSGAPIKDDSGELLGVILVFRDIAERRQAEEKLLRSEEKYRALVENANEVILVIQDGMIKYLNSKVLEVVGYSEDELISKSFLEFIHPDDRNMVAERHIKRLKGEDLPHVYPIRIIDADGSIILMELNAVLITWEGRVATLNFLNDITERKRIEEELMKIEKLESIGVLAGGIAHDLNNLLTAIVGNISLARIYEDPADKDSKLIEAEKASMQVRDLTQQLLTFSSGGAPIKELATIEDILRGSAAFVLSGSNVRCKFSISDDLWLVNVDAGQMNQVINNLIINADQAMPEGGIVEVLAENVVVKTADALPLSGGEYVKISVIDQGIGIPEEHLQKIFDPFFSTKHKGNGLGLATSYSIIKNHDGHIVAESQMGAGTTFRIYIPAVSEEIPPAETVEEKTPITGRGRILVMEDEDIVRSLLSDMLGKIGYTVTITVDGAEAIESYKKAKESNQPYDAVIMDLTIPGGMGGKEAIKKFKEIDSEIKAIVSSGYSNDPIMANYTKYGFKGFLAKPYKIRELSEVLHKVSSNQ